MADRGFPSFCFLYAQSAFMTGEKKGGKFFLSFLFSNLMIPLWEGGEGGSLGAGRWIGPTDEMSVCIYGGGGD